MTKADLITSIRSWLQGDEKAFTGLFYYYHSRLSRFSARFIADQHLVEELVMNVLLKIWSSKDRITNPDTFNAYLYRIMRNEIISQLRRKKILMTPLEVADTTYLTDSEHQYHILMKEYDACIDKLPPRRREIFLMSHRQGMSYAQIAKSLNISLNTVQKQVGAAVRAIRKELDLPGVQNAVAVVVLLTFLSQLPYPFMLN